jgi:hypothetical protein
MENSKKIIYKNKTKKKGIEFFWKRKGIGYMKWNMDQLNSDSL